MDMDLISNNRKPRDLGVKTSNARTGFGLHRAYLEALSRCHCNVPILNLE